MKQLYYLAAAALMMLPAACQDEGDAAAPDVQKQEDASDIQKPGKTLLTFTASDGDASLQKTKYGEYDPSSQSTPILWLGDEAFSIFPAGEDENAEGSISKVDKDDASMCKISVEVENPSAGGYFALYPYSADAAYSVDANSGGKFTGVTIPDYQEVSANQYDPTADVMVAYADGIDKEFNFKHIGTKLGITVPYSNVTEIQISCTEQVDGKTLDVNIAGTADVSFSDASDAVPEIKPISGATNTIRLACADADGFKKGSVYYACLFPTSAQIDLKITFVTSNLKVYHGAKINAMARSKRCSANPTGKKGHCLVTLDKLNQSDNFPKTATKIVFDYKDDGTNFSGNLDEIIYFYNTNSTEYYIVSDHEICLSGSCEKMFYNFSPLKELELANFNTSQVTDMSDMFYQCSALTSLDLGDNFNTSQVTDMAAMFSYCSALTSLDLGDNFNTSQVEAMYMMFSHCSALTSLDLGDNFNTSQVKAMYEMFSSCVALTSLDLGDNFNTSQVSGMRNMFSSCSALTSLDLGDNFNTSQVKDMSEMFIHCLSLATILVKEDFKLNSVLNSKDMFMYCRSLRGGFNTLYSDKNTDAYYARIDLGFASPGYFTKRPQSNS